MDAGRGKGKHPELHSVLTPQELLHKGAHMGLLRQNKSLAHSLPDVPCHHMVLLVGQDNRGRSPGNLLRGPRLTVVSAQGADELGIQVVDGLPSRWSCAFEWALEL